MKSHTHSTAHTPIYLLVDVVEDSNEKVDEEDVCNQKVQGHHYGGQPSSRVAGDLEGEVERKKQLSNIFTLF